MSLGKRYVVSLALFELVRPAKGKAKLVMLSSNDVAVVRGNAGQAHDAYQDVLRAATGSKPEEESNGRDSNDVDDPDESGSGSGHVH